MFAARSLHIGGARLLFLWLQTEGAEGLKPSSLAEGGHLGVLDPSLQIGYPER